MARITSVPLPATTDAAAQDGGMFAKALERLTREVIAVFGPGARVVPVSASERLHSHVLRVAVIGPGQVEPRTHLYLKVSKAHQAGGSHLRLQARIERDFAATSRVYGALGSSGEFRAVRPIACYPDLLAIVTEEVPGDTLLDLLMRDGRWRPAPPALTSLERVFTSTGHWVRAFQRSEVSTGVITPVEIRQYVEHRLQRIESAAPRRGRLLRSALLQRIDDLCASAPEDIPTVPVHADLSPSNVLASEGRVAVIDFAMVRMGHPLQDVARLVNQLDLLATKPYFLRSTVRTMQRALLAGFDESLEPDDPRFRLQVLLQRVNHMASLLTRPYPPVEHVYNWFVRRGHWRWLELEAAGRRESRWD